MKNVVVIAPLEQARHSLHSQPVRVLQILQALQTQQALLRHCWLGEQAGTPLELVQEQWDLHCRLASQNT
jgi:hypothetical protein